MEKQLFEALYNEYSPLVFRRCLDILRNYEEAEDATNNVFEIIYKKKGEIYFPNSYLQRTAKNMGLKHKKKRKKEIEILYTEATNISIRRLKEKDEAELSQLFIERRQGNAEGSNKDLEDKNYEQIEAEMVTKEILNEEDEITNIIFVLFYRDCMTYKEIGDVVGLSKSAVEKRVRKLETKIKQKIYGDIK